MVETLWAEIGRSRRFLKGVGHFERRFQSEGASPTNHSWYQCSGVIALSCGIKRSAVHHLVLSQCTRVTDGQTDRQADRRTEGQNYDSQDRPRICSRGKNDQRFMSEINDGDDDDAHEAICGAYWFLVSWFFAISHAYSKDSYNIVYPYSGQMKIRKERKWRTMKGINEVLKCWKCTINVRIERVLRSNEKVDNSCDSRLTFTTDHVACIEAKCLICLWCSCLSWDSKHISLGMFSEYDRWWCQK